MDLVSGFMGVGRRGAHEVSTEVSKLSFRIAQCLGEKSAEAGFGEVALGLVVERLEEALRAFVHNGFVLMPAVVAVRERMDL